MKTTSTHQRRVTLAHLHRLGAPLLPNPLLNAIFAFWALWHCRHARPPSATQPSR